MDRNCGNVSIAACMIVAGCIAFPVGAVEPGGGHPDTGTRSPVLRDLIWVWGNPEMATEGPHTVATFAQAAPAERASLLGVPNIIMAGQGLPKDQELAQRYTEQVDGAPRLVWEIAADGESPGPAFAYGETIGRLSRLVARYPQIEGVLLDDMSSVGIDHGFKPEHIRNVKQLLSPVNASVQVWGVVYTMNLDRDGINDYIAALDVINLWIWHARDVVDMENYVSRCEALFPAKPLVMGLYLYDYGEGRPIPRELLEEQCATALKLARAGRIEGIVFLTIDNDPEAVAWAADWVSRVGGQTISMDAASSPAPASP